MRISAKLIVAVAAVLVATIGAFSYFLSTAQHQALITQVEHNVHQLSETIKSGTKDDMLLNRPERLHRTIDTIGERAGAFLTDGAGKPTGLLTIEDAMRASRLGTTDVGAAVRQDFEQTTPEATLNDVYAAAGRGLPIAVVNDEGVLVGNPDLRPERGSQVDAGFRAAAGDVRGELVGFAGRAVDRIGWLQNAAGQARPENLDAVDTFGAEAASTGHQTELSGP